MAAQLRNRDATRVENSDGLGDRDLDRTFLLGALISTISKYKRRDNAPLVCSSLLSMRDGKVHTHYMYSFCGRCYPAVGTTLKGGPMEPKDSAKRLMEIKGAVATLNGR